MSKWEGKTTEELVATEKSYLDAVNQVTTPTACMIIRAVSEIRDELERRKVK